MKYPHYPAADLKEYLDEKCLPIHSMRAKGDLGTRGFVVGPVPFSVYRELLMPFVLELQASYSRWEIFSAAPSISPGGDFYIPITLMPL